MPFWYHRKRRSLSAMIQIRIKDSHIQFSVTARELSIIHVDRTLISFEPRAFSNLSVIFGMVELESHWCCFAKSLTESMIWLQSLFRTVQLDTRKGWKNVQIPRLMKAAKALNNLWSKILLKVHLSKKWRIVTWAIGTWRPRFYQ